MKIYIVVFLLMILGHLIADYCLQGWLAQAKQKSWWKKNAPDEKYKYDWIPALICHSIMWAIIVYLPVIYFWGDTLRWWQYIHLISLAGWHGIIDDLKANKMKINLWQDQLLHLVQIILAYAGSIPIFTN